jgi:hypothetical protein
VGRYWIAYRTKAPPLIVAVFYEMANIPADCDTAGAPAGLRSIVGEWRGVDHEVLDLWFVVLRS